MNESILYNNWDVGGGGVKWATLFLIAHSIYKQNFLKLLGGFKQCSTSPLTGPSERNYEF